MGRLPTVTSDAAASMYMCYVESNSIGYGVILFSKVF